MKESPQRLISSENERDLLICAFRYALGRQTYITSTMQRIIRAAWPRLGAGDRKLIQREIRERQEETSSSNPFANPCALGDPRIDAPGWLALLDLPVDDSDPSKDH